MGIFADGQNGVNLHAAIELSAANGHLSRKEKRKNSSHKSESETPWPTSMLDFTLRVFVSSITLQITGCCVSIFEWLLERCQALILPRICLDGEKVQIFERVDIPRFLHHAKAWDGSRSPECRNRFAPMMLATSLELVAWLAALRAMLPPECFFLV
jgi:hypothetical protein